MAKLVTEKETVGIKKRIHTITIRTGSQEVRANRLQLIRMDMWKHYLWLLTLNAVCTESVKK
eukprot:6654390-Ditylum_brightwellii.AAC.1